MVEAELIRYIAENLVSEPSEVRVETGETGRTTVIALHVAKSDMGRVIGKSGRVANAIRDLLYVTARNNNNPRVVLEIE